MSLAKTLILIVLILIQVIVVSLLYNEWFDITDMINDNPSFSPELYHNRTSKLYENLIYYFTILVFIVSDFLYVKNFLFKR